MILRESHADVVSDMSARVDDLGQQLASRRHELPQGHLTSAGHCKLIVGCLSELDIFDHATPCDAAGCLSENARNEGHLGNDMAVSHVPDEHLAIKCITSAHEESIIVRERKVRHFVIVLRQSVDGLLPRVVPHNDVRVFTSLA